MLGEAQAQVDYVAGSPRSVRQKKKRVYPFFSMCGPGARAPLRDEASALI